MDIHKLKKILCSENLADKSALLIQLKEDIADWDIVPVDILRQGLTSPTPEVRQSFIEILCEIPQDVLNMPWLLLAKMIADPDAGVQKITLKNMETIAYGLTRDDVDVLLGYLRHEDSKVRENFIRLFNFIPEHFDEHMWLKIKGFYNSATIDIRNSLREFMEYHGQEHLINNE